MEEEAPKVAASSAPKKAKKAKKKGTSGLVVAGILLIVVAVVLVVWFRLQGETTITGNWNDDIHTKSLMCEATGVNYPLFEYDESNKKETKVNIIFTNNKLSAVSLMHKMYYDTDKQITDSENLNHAAMNKSFGSNGMRMDALGTKFSKGEGLMQFSLYAEADELNSLTVQYFMLSELSDGGTFKDTTVQKIFESKGFKCTTNE